MPACGGLGYGTYRVFFQLCLFVLHWAGGSGSHLYVSLLGAMLHLTDCCLDFMLLVCLLIAQSGLVS